MERKTSAADPSQVQELCRDLVSIESLSGDEAQVAALVLDQMVKLGYDEAGRDDLGSVIGVRRGEQPGPTLVLDAHMDVVPAPEPDRWRRPPFAGVAADGRIWGRGATDIKGSLAALVLAIGGLQKSAFAGTLVVSASVAEERMEGLALGRVLDRHAADAVVICEPTELALGLGHKGRASLVVEAEGRAAHTSNPQRGVNAVYQMTEAIALLRQLVLPSDPTLGPGVMELVEISSKPFPGSSMVPYHCVARFDRRVVGGETRAGLIDEVQRVVAAVPGVYAGYHRSRLECYTGLAFEDEVFHPCWALSPELELVKRAQTSLRGIDQAGEVYYAPYCTNGATSAGERGIPTLIYGAGSIADAHIVDEGVDIAQLTAAFHGYQALARALTRTS